MSRHVTSGFSFLLRKASNMEYDSPFDVSSSGPLSESLYLPTDKSSSVSPFELSSSGPSWSASQYEPEPWSVSPMDDESGTSVCPSEFAVQLPRPDPSC